MIDFGLMAKKGRVDANSEKKSPIEELWQQVMLNPEFKNRFVVYTLEQLARHSGLVSIQTFCNYHAAHIPTTSDEEEAEEEEEDGDGSDVGDTPASEWGTEKVIQQHTCSGECKDSQFAHKAVQMTNLENVQGSHAFAGCYATNLSASSSTPPAATNSICVYKEHGKPIQTTAVGGKRRPSNRTSCQVENSTDDNLNEIGWQQRKYPRRT